MTGDGTFCLEKATGYDNAPDTGRITLLVVGGDEEMAGGLRGRIGDRCNRLILLKAGDWSVTRWQEERPEGHLWAVINLDMSIEAVTRWTNLVRLTLRPNRLVVVCPTRQPRDIITLSRIPAVCLARQGAPCEEILTELTSEPQVDEARDAMEGSLRALTRASEELFPSEDPSGQLARLLKIFKAQLQVDRATVVLKEDDDTLRVVAGFGMPGDLKIGDTIKPSPGSITSWVLRNRTPRLVEGDYPNSSRKSAVRSAVCAPLIVRDELLGAVSFSSFHGGRKFVPSDLSTVSVFATMLAFSMSNHKLQQDMIARERLAAIGRTTATIAHCMKNIVQILEGSVYLLGQSARRYEQDDILGKGHHLVDRATQRLQHLVYELLEYSRPSTPDLRTCDPSEIVHEILDEFLVPPWTESHDFGIEVNDTRPIPLDDRRLVRALSNLISNGLDATRAGGRLRLSVDSADGWVVFSVADSGPGVSEEELPRIFDAFYSTKGSKGTGLGLAMVRKFCEENGGRVEAARCEDLGGLKVSLVLPALAVPENSA